MTDAGLAVRASDRVRILTWNLSWRFGAWRERRDTIAAEIRRVAPDICGLQEVWSLADEYLAQSLAAELGWHWTWVPSPRSALWQRRFGAEVAGVGFGNAVLSRWPIAATASEPLAAADDLADGWLVLFAAIAAPFGAIPFFTTQLSSAWAASALRQAQVAAVCRFVAAHQSDAYPPVLTGDFNAPPDADEVRCLVGKMATPVRDFVLVDAWADARPLEPGWTWDRRTPTSRPRSNRTPGSTTSSSAHPIGSRKGTSSAPN